MNLKKLYYDIQEPSSFTGINNLIRVIKNLKLKYKYQDLVNWLRNQKTYSQHVQPLLKFKRNPIVSKNIDHNWSADLIEIQNPKFNDNYRYILMVIDILSKFGWAEPLLDKKGETVKKAFLKIFRESKRKPVILSTDAGLEFTNKSLKKYLNWRKIKHLIVKDHTKASVVERWNQTIKSKIYKYLSFNKTKRFIDVLDKIIYGYNNSVHSRTKFKPSDVNKFNEKKVFQNLYKSHITIQKPQLRIGEKVRVYLPREKFTKGYLPNYSKEIFYVQKIYNLSPFPKYRIKDRKGNIIRGSYYFEELKQVL